MTNADSFGAGNFYGAAISGGSMANTQNMNSVNLQSMPMSKTSSPLIGNQANSHGAPHAAQMKPQSIDQSEKMNFQSSISQPYQQQQFQKQSHIQQQHQFVQHHQQRQQNQQQQQQKLLNNNAYGQSQVMSDMGSQVKREPGMEQQNEGTRSQVSQQFQLAESQNQFHQSSIQQHSRGAHVSSDQNEICSSVPQVPQPMKRMLHPHQLVGESHHEFSSISVDPALQGQWHPQSQERTQMMGTMSNEQHIQEDFNQRIARQGEAQRNNLPSEGHVVGQPDGPRSTAEPPNSKIASTSNDVNRERQYKNQQRWLLFLRHARKCGAPEGKCQERHCITMQKLLQHMEKCNSPQCTYPRCRHTRKLIHHNKHCRDPACPVCAPVTNFLLQQLERARANAESRLRNSGSGSCKSYDAGDASGGMVSKTPSVVETSHDIQPSLKRMKIEQSFQSLAPESENSAVSASAVTESQVSKDVQHHHQDYQHKRMCMPIKAEYMDVQMETSVSSAHGSPSNSEMKDNVDDIGNQRPDGDSSRRNEPAAAAKPEVIKVEKENDPVKQENESQLAESTCSKSGKPKIKGVSLTELFTPDQVIEHIKGLRQWVGQVCA